MNDNDIKDVLHERAASVAPPTELPATLKRRMRRRQGANVLGVAALVAIIAVGGFSAWHTLSPLGRKGTKPAREVSTTMQTATARGDSLNYGPWSLTGAAQNDTVNPSPAVPLELRLGSATFDVGHPVTDPGAGLIDPQALVLAHITGADKNGPYQVGTLVFGSIGPDVTSLEFRTDPGEGGSTTQVQMFVLPGTEGGWHAFGTVTEADSGTLTARDASGNILEGYALDPFVNSGDPASFLLVVAEGAQGGTSWRLVATGQHPVCIGTEVFTASSGLMGGGCGSAATPDHLSFHTSETSARQPGLTLVYGSVPTDAASIDVTAADGSVTSATLVRCPCGSLNAGFNVFYAELPPNATVDSVTARAADGTVIDPAPLPAPSPVDRVAVPSPNP